MRQFAQADRLPALLVCVGLDVGRSRRATSHLWGPGRIAPQPIRARVSLAGGDIPLARRCLQTFGPWDEQAASNGVLACSSSVQPSSALPSGINVKDAGDKPRKSRKRQGGARSWARRRGTSDDSGGEVKKALLPQFHGLPDGKQDDHQQDQHGSANVVDSFVGHSQKHGTSDA